MTSQSSHPGALFRAALQLEKPLQVVGVINAYAALLAQRCGFRALYLSGAGVANASFGLPDLALTSLPEVTEEIRRITAACPLPLLVDADTGWGSALMIARSVAEIERAGAAGCHLEDQQQAKRCGHRPGKQLVPMEEMADRIKAAVAGRRSDSFIIMARTDSHAVEGISGAIERGCCYAEAGADMIFAEALTSLAEYRAFCQAVARPVLANITEFGCTPLFDGHDLAAAGVAVALYPLSAFRAMNAAALAVYSQLRRDGHQRAVVDTMQNRETLYEILGYRDYEKKLDRWFGRQRTQGEKQ